MSHITTPTDVLDERQLAAELQIPVRTLSQWRYRKVGPPYSKLGRHVRYLRADVDRWVASHTVDTTRQGGLDAF